MATWTLKSRQFDRAICATTSIIFIDDRVENPSTFVKGAIADAKTHVIPVEKDGIAAIGAVLAGYRHVAAVHIVSLGGPGCVYLGNSQLCLDSCDRDRHQLQRWGDALADDADLLLYGSRVAANPPANDAPHPLLDRLHQLTGANIAASATFTGNVRLGGSWTLETTIGTVTATRPFRAEAIRSYAGLVNAPTIHC